MRLLGLLCSPWADECLEEFLRVVAAACLLRHIATLARPRGVLPAAAPAYDNPVKPVVI